MGSLRFPGSSTSTDTSGINPLSMLGGITDIGFGIYNAVQQTKNLNYQKQLQQKIFDREDSAIQRRVADAEAAGFNKFSVMGEGSSSGSVVSTSAPQADYFGSRAVDAMNSMYKLSQEKQSAEQAKLTTQGLRFQNDILENEKKVSDWNTALSVAEFLYQNGFTPQIGVTTRGDVEVRPDQLNMIKRDMNRNPENSFTSLKNGRNYFFNPFIDTKFGYNQYMNYQERKNFFEINQNNKMQSDINTDWAERHQFLNALSQILGGAQKVGSTYRYFKGWK